MFRRSRSVAVAPSVPGVPGVSGAAGAPKASAAMDIPSIIRKSVRMYRDNILVTCEGRSQTYAQMWDRACRLANALTTLGLVPGDRVAMLADNQVEFFEQSVAIAIAGLVRCPMYALNTAPTHAHMLDLVGAKAIIVQDKYAAEVAGVRHQVPTLAHLIVSGTRPTGAGRLDYEPSSPARPTPTPTSR